MSEPTTAGPANLPQATDEPRVAEQLSAAGEHPLGTLPYANGHREPMRLWYTLTLPAIWLVVMVSLWFSVWGIGEGAMAAMLAGLPGHWLPLALVALGLEGTAYPWAQCIGGVAIMAAVGLLQDYLRVRPGLIWAYLSGFALAGVTRLVVPVSVPSVLFWGCIGIYVVSVVLCVIAGAQLLRRRFA